MCCKAEDMSIENWYSYSPYTTHENIKCVMRPKAHRFLPLVLSSIYDHAGAKLS